MNCYRKNAWEGFTRTDLLALKKAAQIQLLRQEEDFAIEQFPPITMRHIHNSFAELHVYF